MRAVLVDPAHGALVVSEVADPVPGPGQLLVRVRAAGLNRADLLARSGKYPVTPGAPLAVGGAELAGEVLATGPGVDGWAVGDRVMGMGPGYAEQAAVDAAVAMAVPADWGWEQAGATPVTLLTAHDALTSNGRLGQGDVVLVNAAPSGVGVMAIQLAARLGAGTVLATSRSAAKLATLLEFLGPLPCPVVPVDLSTESLVDVTAGHSDHGVDVVVDSVGASALADNVRVAALGGRIVQVGRLGGREAPLDLDELARKRLTIVGVTFRTRSPQQRADVVRRCLADVGGFLPLLRARVEAVLPLTDALAAQEQLAGDDHVGKIVLVPL